MEDEAGMDMEWKNFRGIFDKACQYGGYTWTGCKYMHIDVKRS